MRRFMVCLRWEDDQEEYWRNWGVWDTALGNCIFRYATLSEARDSAMVLEHLSDSGRIIDGSAFPIESGSWSLVRESIFPDHIALGEHALILGSSL